MRKRGSVLIVQSQALLDAERPFTLVMPVTSRLIGAAEPLHLHLSAQAALGKDSDLLFDQLRAINNKRLLEGLILLCPPEFMGRVDGAYGSSPRAGEHRMADRVLGMAT